MLIRMLGLVALSVVLLGTLTTVRSTRAQLAETRALTSEAASSMAEFVSAYVEHHRSGLEIVARSMGDEPGGAQRLLAHLQAVNPGLLSSVATDESGLILAIVTRQPLDAPERERLLGQSVADRPYFAGARDTGKAFVSPVFRGRGVGTDWIVAISVPWLDSDGRFAGIVEGSLDLGRIRDRVSVRPGLDNLDFSVRDVTGAEVFGRSNESGDGSYTFTVEEQTPEGWRVSLSLPRGHLVGLVQRQLAFAAFIGLAVLALSAWMATLLARRLSSPIEALTRSVSHYEPGVTVIFEAMEPQSPAEVFALGQRFEDLTRRLTDALAEQRLLREEEEQLRIALQQEVRNREEVIADRTRMLKARNKELKTLARKAEQSARTKSVFLATMSHEMRTPLAAVVGFAEVLQRRAGEDDPRAGDVEVRLLENARRLQSTIDAVLELSALESGQLSIQNSSVPLPEVLQNLVAENRPAAERQSLNLRLDLDQIKVEIVQTDRERLAAVLQHLLSNAIKFTERGEVVLSARTTDKYDWSIAIADTGIGIPHGEQRRILERFYQVDHGDDRSYGGSGLGLALVSELCDLMGLELAMKSEPGLGTKVTLRPRSRQ